MYLSMYATSPPKPLGPASWNLAGTMGYASGCPGRILTSIGGRLTSEAIIHFLILHRNDWVPGARMLVSDPGGRDLDLGGRDLDRGCTIETWRNSRKNSSDMWRDWNMTKFAKNKRNPVASEASHVYAIQRAKRASYMRWAVAKRPREARRLQGLANIAGVAGFWRVDLKKIQRTFVACFNKSKM